MVVFVANPQDNLLLRIPVKYKHNHQKASFLYPKNVIVGHVINIIVPHQSWALLAGSVGDAEGSTAPGQPSLGHLSRGIIGDNYGGDDDSRGPEST